MAKRPRDEEDDGRHASKSSKAQHDSSRSSPSVSSPKYSNDKISVLDSKYPSKSSYAKIPAFKASKKTPFLAASSSLPPLPPISPDLSNAPFTHASVVDSKYGSDNDLTYERLEFLGDAYLEIIATRLIYSRFPNLLTGRQSKLREKMIRNSTLAKFARGYGFAEKVRMDKGARAKMGADRPVQTQVNSAWEKILADVFEAYVAAAILSDNKHGFSIVEKWMTTLWVDIMLETDTDVTLSIIQNRKEELSRMIGGNEVKIEYSEEMPTYLTPDKSRQLHQIAVYLTGWGFVRKRIGGGVGMGKKEAGMRAAADALDNNAEFLQQVAEIKQKSDAERRARLAKERGTEIEVESES